MFELYVSKSTVEFKYTSSTKCKNTHYAEGPFQNFKLLYYMFPIVNTTVSVLLNKT